MNLIKKPVKVKYLNSEMESWTKENALYICEFCNEKFTDEEEANHCCPEEYPDSFKSEFGLSKSYSANLCYLNNLLYGA